MFGTNEVVNPHYFDKLPEKHLSIASVFTTLQGEGPFQGIPAIFVRLAKCNLRCTFCDTFFDKGEMMSFERIFKEMGASIGIYAAPSLVVITGGEPFLQPHLAEFCHALANSFYTVQIESNGNFYQDLPTNVVLVVSPKINEATGRHIRLHPKILQRANFLKFVVSADMPGYIDIPSFALEWKEQYGRQIYVSPMNKYSRLPKRSDGDLKERSEVNERISFWESDLLDKDSNRRNHEHAATLALTHGVMLTLQQHLYCNLA